MSLSPGHLTSKSEVAGGPRLAAMDYSVLQQCMHCGLCLPSCPTYDATKQERHSPRGRIALMRGIADGEVGLSRTFGEEMYYCLGCLACVSACPAGVDYAGLFEAARADVEDAALLGGPKRRALRTLLVRGVFMRPRALRLVGRCLWFWRASGLQRLLRASGLTRLMPSYWRELEAQTPTACGRFTGERIRPVESPAGGARLRVGLLSGCVQDILFSDINRDTADVLLANGVEVWTPPVQPCCGSLHAHNGDIEAARVLARRLLDLFPLGELDAIITNAGGCGSHLRHYDRLLAGDPAYEGKARQWSAKLRDIHEFLVERGFRKPRPGPVVLAVRLTYHESCHLCHGQKVSAQPRAILQALPGVEWVELPESTWCCGSAGIYNLTQPEMATKLRERKLDRILATGCTVVATANPGCHLQLVNGAAARGRRLEVRHPVSLLAEAYRREPGWGG